MSEFTGKVALVVGGGNGVGRAVAGRLAALGAGVAIADLGCAPDGVGHDPDVAARAARELNEGGARALALPLDMAQPEAARQAIEASRAHFGRLDHGVYCAGFLHDRPLLRDSDELLARVLDVQLLGAMRFTRELSRSLLSERRREQPDGEVGGSIVLATWASAFLGSAGQSALAAAAGGLVGFVKTAATELRRHGIRVNAVIPTARTRLTAQLPLFASIRADSLTPEHVAQGVCHLLSDAARDVQGEVIGLAGGRIYAFRHLETSGAFLEGPAPALAAIAAAWRDVTRR